MFTFKPQAKSNAKRFLTATCKLENFQDYLTQDQEGQWGCYLGEDGQPVKAADVAGVAPVGQDGEDLFLPKTTTLAVTGPAGEDLGTLRINKDSVALAEGAVASMGGTTEVVADAEPADQLPAGPGAFGAFAMAQLTAPSNTAPVLEVTRPARENVTPTAGLKIQKDRETRNGVTRFSDGSVGAQLWALFDKVGPDCTVAQARAVAEVNGLSTTSAQIGLYQWRRFNGHNKAAK